MRNGDGQRIGGVIGFGDLIQLQQSAHHILHLAFVRAAVTGDSLLYFVGGVFKGFNARLLQAEHDHAACLSNRQRGLDIGLEE